jgi:hypothetical protein
MGFLELLSGRVRRRPVASKSITGGKLTAGRPVSFKGKVVWVRVVKENVLLRILQQPQLRECLVLPIDLFCNEIHPLLL